MIRVLIVDDHPLARAALRDHFNDGVIFTLVGEAQNGQEALALCATAHPDVVVMDCLMPVMGGVEAAREITCRFPGMAVVLLSTVADSALQQEAAGAGAYQLFSKAVGARTLRETVQQAAQQQRA